MEMHLLYVKHCAGSLAQRRHLPYSKLGFDISLKLLLSQHHISQREHSGMRASGQPLGKGLTFAEVLTLSSVSFLCQLFLGKNSGVQKEVFKGGGTVSKIPVTVLLLEPDVKRHSRTLSLNLSVNGFAWWWLLSISVYLHSSSQSTGSFKAAVGGFSGGRKCHRSPLNTLVYNIF